MSTITAQIIVTDTQAAFMGHQATETGKTVEEVVVNIVATVPKGHATINRSIISYR